MPEHTRLQAAPSVLKSYERDLLKPDKITSPNISAMRSERHHTVLRLVAFQSAFDCYIVFSAAGLKAV